MNLKTKIDQKLLGNRFKILKREKREKKETKEKKEKKQRELAREEKEISHESSLGLVDLSGEFFVSGLQKLKIAIGEYSRPGNSTFLMNGTESFSNAGNPVCALGDHLKLQSHSLNSIEGFPVGAEWCEILTFCQKFHLFNLDQAKIDRLVSSIFCFFLFFVFEKYSTRISIETRQFLLSKNFNI